MDERAARFRTNDDLAQRGRKGGSGELGKEGRRRF